MPGPHLSRNLIAHLRTLTGLALGVPADKRNGYYSYREEEAAIRHCLEYALRPQGCGNDVARSKWTIPYGRTLSPLGGLAKHARLKWEHAFPEYTTIGTEHERPDVQHFCKCGGSGHTFVRRSPFT